MKSGVRRLPDLSSLHIGSSQSVRKSSCVMINMIQIFFLPMNVLNIFA